MDSFFTNCLLLSVGINLFMFLIAYKLQTDKLTDISYSITFCTLTISAFLIRSDKSVPDIIMLVLVNLWSIRLGSYLLNRIYHMGHDKRFDNIRKSFLSFLGFWIVQGISVFIITLPFLLLVKNPETSLNMGFILFSIVALIGIVIEHLADQQKFLFKKQNPNQFIQHGLWKKLRHPNYLGEILVWLGIGLSAFFVLPANGSLIALISPFWIIFLLVGFSGIPPLEKVWKEKYKDNQEFQKYYKQSWRLVPYLY